MQSAWAVHLQPRFPVAGEVNDVMQMVTSTADAPGDISQRAAWRPRSQHRLVDGFNEMATRGAQHRAIHHQRNT